jgi:hypothetical protein
VSKSAIEALAAALLDGTPRVPRPPQTQEPALPPRKKRRSALLKMKKSDFIGPGSGAAN